jgi:hypothetical protein
MVENGFALLEKGVRQADEMPFGYTPRKTAKLNKYAIALSFRWLHLVEKIAPNFSRLLRDLCVAPSAVRLGLNPQTLLEIEMNGIGMVFA